MSRNPAAAVQCPICREPRRPREIIHGDLISEPLCKVIQAAHPEWSDQNVVCLSCLNHFRARYVAQALETQLGELSSLDEDVVKSLREQELVSENINVESDSQMTLGERVADRVAAFGGSWRFILSFGAVLVGWIALNTSAMLRRPFDPYPYIRQESRDRLRAEHDYRVNLKAELEIRHLHWKMDQLLTHQWRRLLEIQQIQTDLMEELAQRRRT
jgi:uncharacterized membrane protein